MILWNQLKVFLLIPVRMEKNPLKNSNPRFNFTNFQRNIV